LCAWFALTLLALSAGGCAPLHTAGKSPLLPLQMSPDSMVLDIIFVRLPQQETEEVQQLWEELDEQQLAPALRQRLTRNGFRVGIAGVQLPPSLEKLLNQATNPDDTPVVAATPPPEGGASVTVTDFQSEPALTRRHLQLRSGREAEIVASGIYPSLPLLEPDAEGQLSGRRYAKAQGVFTMQAFAEADGRVKLAVRPELQYGEPQQEIRPEAGRWLLQSRKRRRAFDDLNIEASLAPGEILVLAAQPDETGSAGHYFFTEQTSAGLTRKLLLVRLSQTQHNEIYGADEPAEAVATDSP
jgi:hypothetical protein